MTIDTSIMKATKSIIGLISIVLLISSCNNNSTPQIDYCEPIFENEIEVSISPLNTNFIFEPGTINVVDSFVIYDGRTNISDKVFHIFSKNTGSYITSFGNVGRAYGELSQNIGYTTDKKNRVIYAFDNATRKTLAFSLEKIIAGEKDFVKEIHLPSIMNNVYSQYFLRLDNAFLGGYTEHRFVLCSDKDSITCSDLYPELDEPQKYKHVERMYYEYLSCMAAKPDGRMFVNATRSGCILEIWKYDTKNIKLCIAKGLFKPNYNSFDRDLNYPRVTANNDAPYGISFIQCTNKTIYALYNNIPSRGTNTIATFDWKGIPQQLYKLSNNIISFDIDSNEKTAYALINNNGEFELVTFSL